MLKALLEERFKLKIHRETKEVSVYDLTIAKGGLKAPRFATGTCTPVDWNTPLPDQLQTPTVQHCIDRQRGEGRCDRTIRCREHRCIYQILSL